jgi:hypothetical protein
MKKYFNPLLTAGTVLALLYTIYGQNKELEKLRVSDKEYKAKIDSLDIELFNSKNELGRYEITLEYFREVNPKEAKRFEKYLIIETE